MCNISSVYVANDIDSFETVVRKSIVNIRKRLLGVNSVVASITYSLYFMYASPCMQNGMTKYFLMF